MASLARWPNLDGRVGTLVRVAYRMLLVLTAIYVILDIPLEATDLFRNSPVVSHYGFAVARNAHGALPVTQLYPSAERAGLHVDDVVIGLGDARLSPGATRFDLAAQLDALNSAPATLLLLDRTGSVRTLVLTPQAQGLGLIHLFYGMPIWAFGIVQLLALSIPLFVLLCASFLLYKKRPSDGEAMMLAFSFLALIFSTSSGSWPFLYARLPDVVSDVAVQLGTALLCIAVAGVPDGRFTSLWARMAVFAAVIYGLAGVLLALRSDNLHFAALQALLQYAAIGLAAVAIVVRYRASAQIARQQIKWVAIGAVVTVLAMATSIALSFWGIDAAMAPGLRQVVLLFLFVVVHIAIPIGMAISVLAYRLFDSEALITRSAAYAALSVSVIGVFAASESVVQSFGAKIVSTQLGTFSGALAATFTAMLIAPMHSRIKRTLERVFRKELFRMREGLPPLVGDLRETSELKAIANIVIERVWPGVRPTAAAIVVGESVAATRGIDDAGVATWQAHWTPSTSNEIQYNKADTTFPMRVPLAADGIGQVGWLLLGPRPDGSLFGKDECKALSEIADPVARALAIAATREARSELYEDTIRSMRTRLEDVEMALAHLRLQKKKTTADKPLDAL